MFDRALVLSISDYSGWLSTSQKYNAVTKSTITVTVSSDDAFFFSSFSFFSDDNVDDEAFSDNEFSSNNTDAEEIFKCKKK